ncbi:hypothetical protein ENBRE01_1157 [Enteropsectra breve]|nr:hypothetical protein ENBRE01_1157 [Enteropsectra breve]
MLELIGSDLPPKIQRRLCECTSWKDILQCAREIEESNMTKIKQAESMTPVLRDFPRTNEYAQVAQKGNYTLKKDLKCWGCGGTCLRKDCPSMEKKCAILSADEYRNTQRIPRVTVKIRGKKILNLLDIKATSNFISRCCCGELKLLEL